MKTLPPENFVVKERKKSLFKKDELRIIHSLWQKDVSSDPKAVQDVSAATNNLLESLGALGVEVNEPLTCTESTTHTVPHANTTSKLFVSKVQLSCL